MPIPRKKRNCQFLPILTLNMQLPQPEDPEQPAAGSSEGPLSRLYRDLAGLERLQIMQFELIREIRRQLDELEVKLTAASTKRRRKGKS